MNSDKAFQEHLGDGLIQLCSIPTDDVLDSYRWANKSSIPSLIVTPYRISIPLSAPDSPLSTLMRIQVVFGKETLVAR